MLNASVSAALKGADEALGTQSYTGGWAAATLLG